MAEKIYAGYFSHGSSENHFLIVGTETVLSVYGNEKNESWKSLGLQRELGASIAEIIASLSSDTEELEGKIIKPHSNGRNYVGSEESKTVMVEIEPTYMEKFKEYVERHF